MSRFFLVLLQTIFTLFLFGNAPLVAGASRDDKSIQSLENSRRLFPRERISNSVNAFQEADNFSGTDDTPKAALKSQRKFILDEVNPVLTDISVPLNNRLAYTNYSPVAAQSTAPPHQ